jgi:hypothetical protein
VLFETVGQATPNEGLNVRRVDGDAVTTNDTSSEVTLYCLGAILAEQAFRNSCAEFGKMLEPALDTLLKSMPRDLQWQALRLSYEMAMAGVPGEAPVKPKLRLVYSRD